MCYSVSLRSERTVHAPCRLRSEVADIKAHQWHRHDLLQREATARACCSGSPNCKLRPLAAARQSMHGPGGAASAEPPACGRTLRGGASTPRATFPPLQQARLSLDSRAARPCAEAHEPPEHADEGSMKRREALVQVRLPASTEP